MSITRGRVNAGRGVLVSVAGVVLIGAMASPGCARWREKQKQRELARAQAKTDAVAGFLDAHQPGLQVELVPVRDTTPSVAGVLGPYETNPVPADPALLYRWRRAGLRVVAVPMDEIDSVVGAFTVAGAGDQRQWAQMPNWAPIVAGPWDDGEVLDTGAGTARVGPGRTRLLARAWFEPWIGDGGIQTTMRLEFAPQRERPRGKRTISAVDAPALPGGEPDAGPVLAELVLTLRAHGDNAYVIVGAAPDADWSDAGESAAPATATPDPGVGPAVPRTPTVGESMLVDRGEIEQRDDSVSVRPPTTVLVIVRPRIPTQGPAVGGASDGATP